MRLAVHSKALQDFFSANCDANFQRVVLSSKIAITTAILHQYHADLSNNTSYLAWFSSTSAAGRFTTHSQTTAPQLVRNCDASSADYGTPSYYGASNLVAAPNHLTIDEFRALEGIGIHVLSPAAAAPSTLHGDNPFLTIAMQSNGTLGFDVLDRFIKPEEDVVVYDKYLNNESVELLEHIASLLSVNSRIRIFHSPTKGAHLLSSAIVANRVRLSNPAITVSCQTCTKAFLSGEHDRHMYLGERIQITFTAGTDCFGTIDPITGARKNKRSKLLFFDVTDGDDLHIAISDGTFCVVPQVGAL